MRILGLLAIFAVGLGPANHALACSCANGASFLQVSESTDLVIRGKILSYHNHLFSQTVGGKELKQYATMRVEVLEVLKGDDSIKESKHIIVEGDNGMLCRHYVTHFPIGSEWVLALPSYEKKSAVKWLSKTVYTTNVCGEYQLPVKDNQVTGNIISYSKANDNDENKSVKLQQTWSLDELRQRIK